MGEDEAVVEEEACKVGECNSLGLVLRLGGEKRGDDKLEERKEEDVWVGLTLRISERCQDWTKIALRVKSRPSS